MPYMVYGKYAQDWTTGIICPVHKKGNQLEGITLLTRNTVCKIFSNILFERFKPYTEGMIGDYQSGFCAGKSTIDNIHSI
ncbi:hypothetical protein J437_LFUL014810 [Ladona fulva]|uniref:Reverse transcriptase domain-containing protein n=1 Tax=Ladona fulva TaxID=123851 RepID=A0A8K0P8D7_LADFU|nr:hypothetical protein J437_LFUL014810 [Ladona fulva]